MNPPTAFAVIAGAGTGLGLVWIVVGLRMPPPRPRRRWLTPARPEHVPLRLAAAACFAVGVGAVTRWPVGAVLAGAAAWWMPRVLGPDRLHHQQVARIEAIAS